ncbi:MAG: DUF2845 domain-containing protein [Pseudomonadota bacterium]
MFLLLISVCELTLAFRCGNQLVQVGDTRYEIGELCGAPDDATRTTYYRSISNQQVIDCDPVESQRVQALGNAPRSCLALVEDQLAVRVDVDVWLYDLGKNRFMQEVHFENGRVVRIETLGYGLKPRQ